MRTFIRTSYAALALAAAELGTGTAPATTAEAPKPEAPAFGDTGKHSNVAAPARKPSRKLSGAAVKPTTDKPNKPAKPAAKPTEAAKPDVHGFGTAYRGASPAIRGHGRKLSPIVLNRVPNAYTDRDAALLKALHGKHAVKPFARLDIDAGALSRLIGHGYVKHVSGMLDERSATFAITPKATAERFKTARAPKA